MGCVNGVRVAHLRFQQSSQRLIAKGQGRRTGRLRNPSEASATLRRLPAACAESRRVSLRKTRPAYSPSVPCLPYALDPTESDLGFRASPVQIRIGFVTKLAHHQGIPAFGSQLFRSLCPTHLAGASHFAQNDGTVLKLHFRCLVVANASLRQ